MKVQLKTFYFFVTTTAYGRDMWRSIAEFSNGHRVIGRPTCSRFEALEELGNMIFKENVPIIPPKAHRALLATGRHAPNQIIKLKGRFYGDTTRSDAGSRTSS